MISPSPSPLFVEAKTTFLRIAALRLRTVLFWSPPSSRFKRQINLSHRGPTPLSENGTACSKGLIHLSHRGPTLHSPSSWQLFSPIHYSTVKTIRYHIR
jgi:hypothetical protein